MYQALLKKSGYKLTKPRQLVLQFLSQHKKPVAIKQIHSSLKNDLDRVTVYRILEVLENLGIVFKEYSDKEALYYLADRQHHHITCRQCGDTQCIPCHHIFNKIKNFSNIHHQLMLSGVCQKCDNK